MSPACTSAAAQVFSGNTSPLMRILVVDDEPAVRTALERALRLEGYDVELAADGAEALQRLPHTPDAVVLDVLMPKVDGLEVCRRLAADDRTPVLMLTARDSIGDRQASTPVRTTTSSSRSPSRRARASTTSPAAPHLEHGERRPLLRPDDGHRRPREVRRGSRRIELTI